MKPRSHRFETAFVLIPAAILGACSDSSDHDGPGSRPDPEIPLETLALRLDGVLKTGLNTINADEVATLLMDANPANDPFVLDVRNPEDFDRGHIPGAVNVPLRTLPAAWLRDPDLVPADRNVVVASYYGGDGNMASLIVNSVRITDPANHASFPWSKTIFMGMMAWNYDPALCNGHRYETDMDSMRVNRTTETTARAGGAYGLAEPGPSRGATPEEALLRRADLALRGMKDPCDLQVPATELAAALDGGTAADLQIVSVRTGADYAKGHIPGAINIGWKEVAQADRRPLLDPARPVLTYCYTGHTGSLATVALRILGYDARNLLYGMDGWCPSASIGAAKLAKFDLNRGWDFPVDDGGADDLGSLAAYEPPSGCVACHTSLTAVYYDRTVANPVPAPPAPPSIGEG